MGGTVHPSLQADGELGERAGGELQEDAGAGDLPACDLVDAVLAVGNGASPGDFERQLATVGQTAQVTAILEAGRRSLDESARVGRETAYVLLLLGSCQIL